MTRLEYFRIYFSIFWKSYPQIFTDFYNFCLFSSVFNWRYIYLSLVTDQLFPSFLLQFLGSFLSIFFLVSATNTSIEFIKYYILITNIPAKYVPLIIIVSIKYLWNQLIVVFIQYTFIKIRYSNRRFFQCRNFICDCRIKFIWLSKKIRYPTYLSIYLEYFESS